MLKQGAELRKFCVPLNNIHLKSELGLVVVGVRPSLPVHGVSFILGNDLAGGQVIANPYVSNVPQDSVLPSVVAEQTPAKPYKANTSTLLSQKGEQAC